VPAEQMVTGEQVQAAIDACYIWRGHVMPRDKFSALLARHKLAHEKDLIVMPGVFTPGGAIFAIVAATESPYGFEIAGT
jgi:hypothetical protein